MAVAAINSPALDALREKLLLKSYSRHTRRTYCCEFSQLLYLLKERPVNSLTPERLKDYFLYCVEKLKMSEAQMQSRINAVKFYFDNEKHALLLKLCYGMGLRVSEIVNLKITDIDSGNTQVLIARAKGKKDRYVNLPESILEDLRNYYRTYHPKKYLFEEQDGGKYSIRSAQNVFRQAMKKAGINKAVGIHGLRHSFATHLLEKGTDISYIQQLLGHNDVKTTMLYAKVAQKNLRKIKSPLDEL